MLPTFKRHETKLLIGRSSQVRSARRSTFFREVSITSENGNEIKQSQNENFQPRKSQTPNVAKDLYGWGWNEGSCLGIGPGNDSRLIFEQPQKLPLRVRDDANYDFQSEGSRSFVVAKTAKGLVQLSSYGYSSRGQAGEATRKGYRLSKPRDLLKACGPTTDGLHPRKVHPSCLGYAMIKELDYVEPKNYTDVDWEGYAAKVHSESPVFWDYTSAVNIRTPELKNRSEKAQPTHAQSRMDQLKGLIEHERAAANLRKVVDANSFSLVAVSSSKQFSVAVTSCGRLLAWGRNNKGQLGLGYTHTKKKHLPRRPCLCRKIPERTFISSVALGNMHVVAMTREGEVYTWGQNVKGQLGIGILGSGEHPDDDECASQKPSEPEHADEESPDAKEDDNEQREHDPHMEQKTSSTSNPSKQHSSGSDALQHMPQNSISGVEESHKEDFNNDKSKEKENSEEEDSDEGDSSSEKEASEEDGSDEEDSDDDSSDEEDSDEDSSDSESDSDSEQDSSDEDGSKNENKKRRRKKGKSREKQDKKEEPKKKCHPLQRGVLVPQRLEEFGPDANFGPAASVHTGAYYTMVQCSSSTLYSFGDNAQGQLGHGTIGEPVLRAQQVQFPEDCKVHHVACGGKHALALCSLTLQSAIRHIGSSAPQRYVLSWGSNQHGQLGLGASELGKCIPVPQAIYHPLHNVKEPSQVSAGKQHSACCTANGELFIWGCNYYGQVIGEKSKTQGVITRPTIVSITVPKKDFLFRHKVSLEEAFCHAVFTGDRNTVTEIENVTFPKQVSWHRSTMTNWEGPRLKQGDEPTNHPIQRERRRRQKRQSSNRLLHQTTAYKTVFPE